MSPPIAVGASERPYDRDISTDTQAAGVVNAAPAPPSQAAALLEMLGRMLPEERVWICDQCGSDVAMHGIIDMEDMRVLCKQCFKEVR